MIIPHPKLCAASPVMEAMPAMILLPQQWQKVQQRQDKQ